MAIAQHRRRRSSSKGDRAGGRQPERPGSWKGPIHAPSTTRHPSRPRYAKRSSSIRRGHGCRTSGALGICSRPGCCPGSMSLARKHHPLSGRTAGWERYRALLIGARDAGWNLRILSAIRFPRRIGRWLGGENVQASSRRSPTIRRRVSLHGAALWEGEPAMTRRRAYRVI
jgi:hypothetical protein